MATHTCIKPGCGNTYTSEEVEAYYCPTCDKVKKGIAKQVDAKLQGRSRKAGPSFDEQMAQLPKIPGTNIPYIQ